MKYIELSTGKAVQASKGWQDKRGGIVVHSPDVWVVLGDDGITLRSEDAFRKNYESVVDAPEKLEDKYDWRVYFNQELGHRGEYVMDSFLAGESFRIPKDAADVLCQFMLREWYTKRKA